MPTSHHLEQHHLDHKPTIIIGYVKKKIAHHQWSTCAIRYNRNQNVVLFLFLPQMSEINFSHQLSLQKSCTVQDIKAKNNKLFP